MLKNVFKYLHYFLLNQNVCVLVYGSTCGILVTNFPIGSILGSSLMTLISYLCYFISLI